MGPQTPYSISSLNPLGGFSVVFGGVVSLSYSEWPSDDYSDRYILADLNANNVILDLFKSQGTHMVAASSDRITVSRLTLSPSFYILIKSNN